jgi:hypothetical protein
VGGGVDHGLGVGDAQRHGFLNQDVLAGFGCCHGFGKMLIIPGGDVHSVNVATEELIEIGGLSFDAAVSPIAEPARFVVIQPPHAYAESGERGEHPSHGDVAGPDQTDGERPGRETSSNVDAALDGVSNFTDPAVRPPMK